MIREKTSFKNPNNTSCIDLIITNRPKSFQNSMIIETFIWLSKNVYYSNENVL